MRKYIKGLILVVVLLGFYFVLAHYFPKDAGRYPVFLILFLADYYLYSSYKKIIKSWKKPVAFFTRTLYWLPAILIGVLVIGSFLLKEQGAKRAFITLVGGFIFVGYASKLIPDGIADDCRRD